MKPISLKLSNFMSHGESFIDFSKTPNVLAIIGMEDGSLRKTNTSGKTTIFSAIRFALFNASVTVKSKIVRIGAKKCEVEFVFELSNGTQYKIYRSRTKTTKVISFFVKNDNDWEDISCRTPTDTEVEIAKVIKINQKTFENSSYFKEGDKFNLAATSPEKRKVIIRDMLQLKVWATYEETAKQFRSKISKQIDLIKAQISSLSNPKEDIPKLKIELRNTFDAITDIENNIIKYSDDLDDVKKSLMEAKQTISVEYPNLKEKLKNETEFKNRYNTQIEQLETSLNKLIIIANASNISTIENQIKGQTTELEQLENNPVEQISTEEYDNIATEITKFKATIKNNEALLKIVARNIPDDDFCPICYTELNDENREKVFDIKQTRINEITTVLNDAKTQANKLLVEQESLNKKIKTFQIYTEKQNKVKSNIVEAKDSLKVMINNINQNKIQQQSLEADIITRKEAYNKSNEIISNIETQIKSIEANSNNHLIKQLEVKLSKLNKDIENLRGTHSTLMYTKGKHESALNARVEDYKKLQKYETDLKEAEYEHEVYKVVTKVFSSSGIPAMIVSTVLDGIQNEANSVLGTLRPGMQIQFYIEKQRGDGKQEDTLGMRFFADSVEWDYDDLSGGQKGCVALALKFAIAIINRQRCNADIRMLLLDEVDQALDAESIDTFFDVIKQWGKDMVILNITHNNQLKSKFNSFILVKKTNKVATAEVIDEGTNIY